MGACAHRVSGAGVAQSGAKVLYLSSVQLKCTRTIKFQSNCPSIKLY